MRAGRPLSHRSFPQQKRPSLARPIRYAGASIPPDIAQHVRARLSSFLTI